MTGSPSAPLARRLGLVDATAIGVGSMLGAGVFVAFGPAGAAAGSALPLALLLAGVVAWLNADSSARLASVLPTSGGAYAYGRARVHPAVGTLAGVAFLVGKTVSAAAIATTVAAHLWPAHARPVAVLVVVALTAAACAGVQRGARATLAVVVVVLAVLAVVVVAALAQPAPSVPAGGAPDGDVLGTLAGAGTLFFAFAGYARIATLGEEVRDPARTLPRAIAGALALVLVVYAAVGVALVRTLGLDGLATSGRPVADAAAALGVPVAVVATAAVLAATASCLGVLLGLSRTTLAMARDGVLPRGLARTSGRPGAPRPVRAQLLAGAAVALAVAVLDLASAIAVSSVCVLVYYGVAHVAALTLEGRPARRAVPALGLLGCLVVAAAVATRLLG